MNDVLTLDDLHNWVRVYQSRGLTVHPCPTIPRPGAPRSDGKTPVAWWAKRTAEAHDFRMGDNVGVRLGVKVEDGERRGYLCDVDIDIDPANAGGWAIVEEFLPATEMIYGRRSKPRAHRLYLITEPLAGERHVGGRGSCLIEFRALSAKGKETWQSVVPPGLHRASEERIAWVTDGDDRQHFGMRWTVVPGKTLRDRVRMTALALAILDVWPARGSRHDARLAFSKVLLDIGASEDETLAILGAVVDATGGDLDDLEATIRSTAEKLKAGDTTMGASWVVEHIAHGRDTLKAIDAIIDRKRIVPAGGIDVLNLDLKLLTPQAWSRVAAANDPPRLFMQGGTPVRIGQVAHKPHDAPTWGFQTLDERRLMKELVEAVPEGFWRGRGKGAVQVVPPSQLVTAMLATRPEHIPLAPVTRIVHAPTVAPDGTVQTSPGYQHATGAFYVSNGLDLPAVSATPTRAELDRAVALLKTPIADFPFVADADRANAIAFGLLPFVRDVIDGATPLHLFEKPTPGTGATLLTDALLFPALGGDVAKMSQVEDDDEWRKQITSTLIDGPAVVLIDNVRELVSPQIAKAVTDRVWKSRILGQSRDANLRVECAWGATGNNPTLHQEIRRRAVPVRLDAKMESPWGERAFAIPDLRSWVRDNRGDLVWAALTVARAWFAAGSPPPRHGRSLGMFEQWARVVGGMLDVAGIDGFLNNLDELRDADVETDAIQSFLEDWHERHGDTAVRVSDLALWAFGTNNGVDALLGSTTDRGRATQFSFFVQKLRGRVVTIGGGRWRVELCRDGGVRAARRMYRLTPLSESRSSTVVAYQPPF